MELKEFLNKFLPNYEEKIKEVTNEPNITTCAFRYRHFQDKYFPEALENFADIICQKQKRNCIEEMLDIGHGYEIRDCENAEQPKINEL